MRKPQQSFRGPDSESESSCSKFRTARFTLVEIMMTMIIIAIMAALLLPYLKEAKTQAKYVRWLQFNRSASNDPDCLINFNFQGNSNNPLSAESPGDVLVNSSIGTSSEGFTPKLYNGYLRNKNGGAHNFEWVRAGRFGRFKWALQFNGSDTYVLIPTTNAIDFTPYTGFTILCWVKFDKLGFGDTIFSKSLWGTASDAAAQYDMYYNPYAGSFGQGSFDIDVFTTCGTWTNTDVDFDKAGWVHFALRYKATGMDAQGKPTGEITAFINGQPLGDYVDTTNENPQTATATGYQPCIDMRVPFILGAAGVYRKYWDPDTYDPNDPSLANEMAIKFNFQGKMDELLVYKRALKDSEIVQHYDMGKE
ncbi:MAG: LamG domain-containing protein [Kiritimatiellaeota bacterium]|nr:LamG domain-containing protein [Kiritimatiellota bacterium]